MNEPKQVTAPKTMPLTIEAFGPNDKTTVYWLAGSGFLINARGTLIMIDPVLKTMPKQHYLSEIGLKLKVDYPIDSVDVPKLDALLYTHCDDDHLATRTAQDLSKLNAKIIGPQPVFRKLINIGVNHESVEVCRTGDQFTVGSVTIEITPADHPWQLLDPPRFGKPFRRDDCCGFMLTTPDGKYYFPGDTRLMEEHLLFRDVDVLALDVSVCTYHLNHLGAIALANSLPDALLIPYHYGTYDVPESLAHCGDPTDVFSEVIGGQTRGRILAPGEPISVKDGRESR